MATETELDARALSYLMTAVIRHLHRADPFYWRDFLANAKEQREGAALRKASLEDETLQRVIGIVEHAMTRRGRR